MLPLPQNFHRRNQIRNTRNAAFHTYNGPSLPSVISSGNCLRLADCVVDSCIEALPVRGIQVNPLSRHRCRPRRYLLVWLAALLAGCMTMSPGPRVTTQRIIDLPAPLGAQDEYATRRPAPAPRSEVAGPQNPRSQPLPAADDADAASSEGDVALSDPDEAPAAVSIPPETADSRTAIESLPTIELDEVAGGEPLELALNAPARKQLGGAATFRLTLRNTSEHPQDGLVIHCRFDDELVFAGSDEHEVLQRIDHLAAGEAKELAINLSSTAIGSHACRFVVMKREGDAEIELAHREASVEFVTRQVEIDLAGPTQRTEGSRAEFIVTLVNRSPKTIHDVQAVISFDKALVPKEASAEAVQNPGNLLWRLGPLESQEKVQLQVEFECRIKARSEERRVGK